MKRTIARFKNRRTSFLSTKKETKTSIMIESKEDIKKLTQEQRDALLLACLDALSSEAYDIRNEISTLDRMTSGNWMHKTSFLKARAQSRSYCRIDSTVKMPLKSGSAAVSSINAGVLYTPEITIISVSTPNL